MSAQLEDGQIDVHLVRRLVADQFPHWAHLDVRPVQDDGWDNRTFRLGEELSVRLPSHRRYAAGIAKEDAWLPMLARHLPVPIPQQVASGQPGAGYPFPWSVRKWLLGEPARHDRIGDLDQFARDAGTFLVALWRVDPDGGPPPGEHCFYRGAPPAHYDAETRRCLAALDGRIDRRRAAAVWDTAVEATWSGTPGWFHGDVAVGNLLVWGGSLAAVIDFGTCGVGDHACDLVLAWTFLDGPSRRAFRDVVDQDAGTWERARGWALWKALLELEGAPAGSAQAALHERTIAAVLDDHDAAR